MSAWRAGVARLLVPTLALALAGCLGGEPPPTESPTPLPLPTPVMTVYQLDETVWVEGLVVTFHRATASLDAKGGPVTVDFHVANPGTDTASLDAPIDLAVAGRSFEPVAGTALPEIPMNKGADVTVEFDVLGVSAVDAGVVRIGRSGDHQAVVPLRPEAGTTVSLQPQEGRLAVGATAGGIRLVLRHREIRWDLPDWYQELPIGTEALTLTYDVTYLGDFSGGLAFTGDNVALRLPDGTLVAPRRDGHSQSVVLIGPRKTATALASRFEIPSGLTGIFALVVMDGSIHRAATFQIGP